MRFYTILFMLMSLVLAGCDSVDPEKGYTTASLYDDSIETVCVEMFDSMSFRRGVEFELTNALVQRITANTPYKIRANKKDADSVIYGKILDISERILSHQRELDRPMQEQLIVIAEVTWKDLRTGKLLMDRQRFRFSGNYAALQNDSIKVASQEAVNKIAVEIVETMEKGW